MKNNTIERDGIKYTIPKFADSDTLTEINTLIDNISSRNIEIKKLEDQFNYDLYKMKQTLDSTFYKIPSDLASFEEFEDWIKFIVYKNEQ